MKLRTIFTASLLILTSSNALAANYAGTYEGEAVLSTPDKNCGTPNRRFALVVDNLSHARMLYSASAGTQLTGGVGPDGAVEMTLIQGTWPVTFTGQVAGNGAAVDGKSTVPGGCGYSYHLTKLGSEGVD